MQIEMKKNETTVCSEVSDVKQLYPIQSARAANAQSNIGVFLGEASPEIEYAEKCASDTHISSEGNLIYKWTGDYWKVQENKNNLRDALSWLGIFHRKRANAACADSCVKTAAIQVSPLPKKPQNIVIPVDGVWLVMDQQHNLHAVEPRSSLGITYKVQGIKTPAIGIYQPAPVPEDSLFGAFIKSSLPDEAVRELVQTYIGYSLSNENRHCAQMWIGSGSNGKSCMLNIVRALHEKSVAICLDKLEGFDLAAIIGASLITADEAPKRKINQQALKSIISGGAIQITPKYEQPVTINSAGKLIFCSNHLPSLDDHSTGWWRRWHLIDWNVQVSKAIPDLDLKIIQSEMHIVLDWALAGLQKLMKQDGFIVPEKVAQAMVDAKEESNSVVSWIINSGVALTSVSCALTEKGTLYYSYEKYCDEQGSMACNQSQFYKRVKAQFPDLIERKEYRGSGVGRIRIRCVNLSTGIFNEEDHLKEIKAEQLEIDKAFATI